jgi:hypothetical protein
MAKTLRPWSNVQPLEHFQREIDELFSRFVGGRGPLDVRIADV